MNTKLSRNETKKQWHKYKLMASNLEITSSGVVYKFYSSKKDNKNYFAYKIKKTDKLSEIFELENLDFLNKKLFDFRKIDIFSDTSSSISGIEIINESDLIIISRNSDNEWLDSKNTSLDKVKINSFIDSVKSTEVVKFINGTNFKKYGLDNPKKSLVFKDKSGNVVLKIDFGKTNNDLLTCLFNGKMYEISSDILEKLNIKAFK